jgi:hypothetical protein
MHEMVGVDFEHHDLCIVGRNGITVNFLCFSVLVLLVLVNIFQ